MKTYYLTCLSILMLIAVLSCKKSAVTPASTTKLVTTKTIANSYVPDSSFKIVAYFSSSSIPDSIDISKYKMITHLLYAFLTPNSDGSLVPLSSTSQARFDTVLQRAKANNVKTGISVSTTASSFATLAASSTARSLFVNNILAFVKTYNLDGVDIDWEYPSSTDGSGDNFVILAQSLSDSLHKYNKFLSAAITPGLYAGQYRDGIETATFSSIDFFNIMVYDAIGWDHTQPNQHSSYNMATTSLNYWVTTRGMPQSKAILGIPAYGRQANNTSMDYRTIVASNANITIDTAVVNGATYYFNGTTTVKKKAALAKSIANGIMFWEFYKDVNSTKSLIKAANDTLGRSY